MIFLSCLLSNFFMFGVICFVQVVHYPVFFHFRFDDWKLFHKFHSDRTGIVVSLPMLIQLISTALLKDADWILYTFTALSIGVTGLISMPLHQKLSKSFNLKQVRLLILTNWLRVLGWGGASLHLAYKLSKLVTV